MTIYTEVVIHMFSSRE